MFAKLKSPNFIDTLVLELTELLTPHPLKAVLKDETGHICSILNTYIKPSQKLLLWDGLNDLPYGVYSLEISCHTAEQQMRLVKRI